MTTHSHQIFKLHVERVHALRRPDRVKVFPFNDTVAAMAYAKQLNDDASANGLPYLYRVTTVKAGR